jgi:hypothetical protein
MERERARNEPTDLVCDYGCSTMLQSVVGFSRCGGERRRDQLDQITSCVRLLRLLRLQLPLSRNCSARLDSPRYCSLSVYNTVQTVGSDSRAQHL